MADKIIVVLPCHNQEDIIQVHLPRLREQSHPVDHVVVIDDHSDNQTLRSSEDGWLRVVYGDDRGRSTTRNRGIKEALAMGATLVIFMDGDSIVEDEYYIERLLTYIPDQSQPALVFGTRVHTERPYDFERWVKGEKVPCHRFRNKPSDLLTANMDNLMTGEPLIYKDLREVAKVPENFNKLTNFNDQVDFILTGMVTWSCNFAVTSTALSAIQELMDRVYDLRGMWFDEVAFRTQWGYEDIAFGLDALYAGVSVKVQDTSRVVHFMHGRSDDHFTHIQGKHLLMDRYRILLSQKSEREGVLITNSTISINGRSFDFETLGSREVRFNGKNLRVGNLSYNFLTGDFKKDSLLRVLICRVYATIFNKEGKNYEDTH
jgi:glycosyltransferase involved in cell wall biosynthesis